MLAALVLMAVGCRQLNASHCGNQQGDLTCEQRNIDAPFCSVCEAANDGCVATRVEGCGIGASSGPEPTTSGTPDESSTAAASTAATTATETVDSSTGEPDLCGNGNIDEGEGCDGEMLPAGIPDCEGLGFGPGTPGCTEDCTTVDYTGCPAYNACGDDIADLGEDCDGTDLNEHTCDDIDNRTGPGLECTDDCTFDTTACAVCKESGEDCSMSDVCCNADEVCAGLSPHCCIINGLGLCTN